MRQFELVSKYKEDKELLPERSTKTAAGYDFRAAETITVPSLFRQMIKGIKFHPLKGISFNTDNIELKPTLVSTGVKCYMEDDDVLDIYNRSSSPKKGLIVSNGVGVIDSDYVDNEDNEGEIFIQYFNFSLNDVTIEKGTRIAQGVFKKYLTVDNEEEIESTRTGGHGSTGS